MISQTGGTKTIAKSTRTIVKLDGMVLLAAITPCITIIKTLSVGSMCAMVLLVEFDPTKMKYELRSEEINEDGSPIHPAHVNDTVHGKLHNSVVLKISVVQASGGMLDDYTDSKNVLHEKATVTLADTVAEWKGQEYIHAMLRSSSGISPCPDAIANIRYDMIQFSDFHKSIKLHLGLATTENSLVFAYLLDQLRKNKTRSIDILVMDKVPGIPLAAITDRVENVDMSKQCCAIFATVVAKTGFAAADAHDNNWLIDAIANIKSMIDFGRGSYLLSISTENKLMAGIERWLNPLPIDRRSQPDMHKIKCLWNCLGQASPVGMSWREWFSGLATSGMSRLHELHMEKITMETTHMMRGVLEKFRTDLAIGDPTCPAFLLSPTKDQRSVCKNLHKLFVLTALCGGLFHAVDYRGQTPIQLQALDRVYGMRGIFNSFDNIIIHSNIDLDRFQQMYGLQPGLDDVCAYMQPLITDRSFAHPYRMISLDTPIGVDGDIEIKRKAAAAAYASATAAENSLKRHKTHVNFKSQIDIDSDIAIEEAKIAGSIRVPPARARTPARARAKTPTPARARAQSPAHAKGQSRVQSPSRKRPNIPHAGHAGGKRLKRRTNRTKYRRQNRHTRKLRN